PCFPFWDGDTGIGRGTGHLVVAAKPRSLTSFGMTSLFGMTGLFGMTKFVVAEVLHFVQDDKLVLDDKA
ncbi:MAG: hypothetical protein WA671_07580, partial [Candidatus Sulfotelmatobacter sp.]